MKRTSIKKKKKSLLTQRINELVSLVKNLCPEAEVTVLTGLRYEDEDAVIKVVLPPEKYDEVEEVVTRRETEILWEDGLFILTQFYEKKPSEPVTTPKE